MHLSTVVQEAIAKAQARVRVGYPWWLRPWLGRHVLGITLGRRIYLRSGAERLPREFLERLMRHELAHVRQVERLGLIVFLWRYVTEFAANLWRFRSPGRAYAMISFEIEARAAEGD